MKIEKNTATIMSSNGQFYKVTFKGKSPKIGQEFSGKVITKTRFINKNLITAACIFFVILFGGVSFAYYTPASTIEININPSMQIKTNIFNRIISCKPLNNDGKKLLASINLTHKLLDDGLKEIIEQSKKDNFINNSYVKSENIIQVKISTSNNQKVDLPKFEEEILTNNLNADIVNDGTVKHIESNKNSDNSSNTNNSSSNNTNTNSSSTSTNTISNTSNNTTNSAINGSNNYQSNNPTSNIPNGFNNNENGSVNNGPTNNSFPNNSPVNNTPNNNILQNQPINNIPDNNIRPTPYYNNSTNNDSGVKPYINDPSKDKSNIIPNNNLPTNEGIVPNQNQTFNNGILVTPTIPMNNFSNNNFFSIPDTTKKP